MYIQLHSNHGVRISIHLIAQAVLMPTPVTLHPHSLDTWNHFLLMLGDLLIGLLHMATMAEALLM